MLRPESPLADHRSLLSRRLLPVKAQIAPADKRKNRRSLELAPPEHATYDYPKLLISKTTDSLNSECPRKLIHKQDSTESLKRVLIPKHEDKRGSVVKQESGDCAKRKELKNECRKTISGESIDSSKRIPELHKIVNEDGLKKSSDKKGNLETPEIETEVVKRIYERRTGCAKPTLPPVAERGASPRVRSPSSGSRTPEVAAVVEGVVRWGSDLLSPPKDEPRLRSARSCYGYGTLPSEPDKVGYFFLKNTVTFAYRCAII